MGGPAGLVAFSVAAALVAGPVFGQSFEHKRSELELSYDRMSFDTGFSGDLDLDIWSIEGRTDFGISGGFGIQVDLGYSDSEIDAGGTSVSTDVLSVSAHPYYEFGPTARAGLFLEYGDVGIDTFDEDANMTYYGFETMLTPVDNVGIELFAGFGTFDADGSDALDTTIYGTEVTYGVLPNLATRIRYSAEELDISDAPFDVSLSEFTVGLDYYSDGFGSNVPFVVSANYTKVDIFSVNEDQIGIGVTIALGGGTDSSSRKLYSERGLFSDKFIFASLGPSIISP